MNEVLTIIEIRVCNLKLGALMVSVNYNLDTVAGWTELRMS